VTAASAKISVNGSHGRVSGELIDLLIEAVVLAGGPRARSAVVCDLLDELCNAVDWLHGTAPPDNLSAAEAASLRQLLVAAQDHQLRMRKLGSQALAYGGRR
jgi:hypothetical protein